MDTEHLRQKAEIFLRNNLKVFIKDIYENYHFCYVKEINRDWIIVQDFKGNMRGERIRVLWIDIVKLEEYKEVEK